MISPFAALQGLLARLSPQSRAIALILFSTLCFTSMHTVIRYAATTGDMHPFEVAFFRNIFGLLVLTPIFWRRGRGVLRTRKFHLHAIRGCIQVFAMLMFFYALSISPLAKLSAVSFSAPLFATIGAIVFLGERIRARRIAALVIGFAGAMIIIRPGMVALDLGAMLVLASSAIWACAMLIIKVLTRTDSAVTITTYQSLFLAPFTAVAALFFWQWPTWELLGLFVVMGACGTLGHLAMAEAFKHAETTAILPFDFVRLIWASAIGYVVFAEVPEVWTWVGGSVIFASTTYIAFREARLRRGRMVTKGTAKSAS
ncbi:MAG: DMT family transporter [Alphaproteobacteria bacterium]|jgi:drug/metabolite transporter (DMT)-like permease|nr:DMT family transporter [Alphaproteobacteria bacterium]MDP6566744.1 DMT family transporter [Alphaproteobacteria bacterium]MDP6812953.1 DMT family transporter [Alphaproteobacteria bacterium]